MGTETSLILASGGDIGNNSAVPKKRTKGSKASHELAVELDIERFRSIKERRIFAEIKTKGKGMKTKHVKEIIEDFFKSEEKCLTIYYTGHGDKDGDWIFQDGYISFDFIWNLIEKKYAEPKWDGNIDVCCDCCFSGNWCVKASQKNMSSFNNQGVRFFSAAGPNDYAYDNVFSYVQFLHADQYKKDNGKHEREMKNVMIQQNAFRCICGELKHAKNVF
eukprot:UN04032